MPEATTDHRRATAERNVEAILDATEALLARGSATSTTAVANEAGVSRVTVYAHFPTREDLIAAVVERAVRRTSAAIDSVGPEQGSPVDALDRLVAIGWSELDRHSAMAAAAGEHLGPSAMRRAHRSVYGRIEALVERGRAEGAFRGDVPADWLVSSCLALMHACGDEVRAGRLDAEAAPEILKATLRDVFVGAAGRQSGTAG